MSCPSWIQHRPTEVTGGKGGEKHLKSCHKMPQTLFSAVGPGHPSCTMRKGAHVMATRGAERGRTAGKVSSWRARAAQQRRRKTAGQSTQETRACNRIRAPESCPSPATSNTCQLWKSQLNRGGKKYHNKE